MRRIEITEGAARASQTVQILFVNAHPVDSAVRAAAEAAGHSVRGFASAEELMAGLPDAPEAVVLIGGTDGAGAAVQRLGALLPVVALAAERQQALDLLRQGASDTLLVDGTSPPPELILRALQQACDLHLAQAQADARRRALRERMRMTTMRHLLSDLAHELNQPLSAILNYARGALRGLDAGMPPERIRTALEGIGAQAERASEHVAELRRTLGRDNGEPRAEDANAMVHAALDLFEESLRRNALSPELDLAAGLPAVRVDAALTEQVLIHLLSNAVEAMQDRAPGDRRLRVRTRALADSAGVEVSIADSGPGLSSAERERALDPFFTTKPHRVGLGLSVCRRILSAQEGTLTLAESTWGGLEVRLVLPLAAPAA